MCRAQVVEATGQARAAEVVDNQGNLFLVDGRKLARTNYKTRNPSFFLQLEGLQRDGGGAGGLYAWPSSHPAGVKFSRAAVPGSGDAVGFLKINQPQ